MNTYEKEGRGGQLLLTRQPTRLSVLNDERCLRVPTRSGPLGVKDLSCKSGQDAYLAQSAAAGAAGDEGLFLGTLMNRALSWLPRLSRGVVTTCPEHSRGTGADRSFRSRRKDLSKRCHPLCLFAHAISRILQRS